MRRVLVTGFEPFEGSEHNISGEIAQHLDGATEVVELGVSPAQQGAESRAVEVRWECRVLSVDEEGSREVADLLADGEEWDAILQLGFAEGRRRLCLESGAVNEADFRIPDNSGRQRSGSFIDEEGPPLQLTTAPMEMLLAEFASDEDVRRSDDAGRFVCNETCYRTLRTIDRLGRRDRHGRPLPAIFVHVPPASQMPFERQVELVRRVGALLTQRPRVRVVAGIILADDDRVLAARRAPDEAMPGNWEFPGGKVEPGESEAEAVEREIAEELGVEVRALRCLERLEHGYHSLVVELSFWLCEPVGALGELRLSAHDQTRWLQNDDLTSVEWLEPDIDFIRRLQSEGLSNLRRPV